jgi:hypothetical protein
MRFEKVVAGMKRLMGSRNRRLILALALVAGCAAIGFVVRAYNKRVTGSPMASERPTGKVESRPSEATVSFQSGPSTEKFEPVVVTLQPSGFHPTEVVREEGRAALIVVNRTGLKEIALNLDRQAGARLRATRISENRPRWGEMFDLTPGQYVISEENHPQWTCTITVKAK